MRKLNQKVENFQDHQNKNEINQEFRSKNISKDDQNIFKDSLQEYQSIIEFNNIMREKQFVLDGTKKDFELPKYDMLKDRYLSHYFISDQRSNQLVQSGLLKSHHTVEQQARQQLHNENRIAQSKFNCLSSSQQLSKECKVYIDKYLKNPLSNKGQNVKNLKIETNQDQNALPIILPNSSVQSANNYSYAQKRNQIISLRFKQSQRNETKSILNSSKPNSKTLSKQSSSKNFFQISPIPKQKGSGAQEEKRPFSKTYIDDSQLKEVTDSKEIKQDSIQENYQKSIIISNNNNNNNELVDLPENSNKLQQQKQENHKNKQLFEKSSSQNDKFKQKYMHHRKFILKPIQQRAGVQQVENQKIQDQNQEKNNEKQIFYNQNELKLTEQQHVKVVEIYNKDYLKKQKKISQQSIQRLYTSNQPKKERMKENNVIQTLSKTEFLEFLKQNNEKIRQRNKEAASKIGSRKFLKSEEDLDKKSLRLNSKGNISQISSCQQIKIEPQPTQTNIS
ncbi:hypothetical protein TTHERM_01106050 (macronuclear) [Tetrahymena thermophila SB210]|uniref:Uncharacterized protein n=1 Tax=Tetrahymena thermophila (strain SB210) TaxID=312017 RepID=Q22BF2_TETTS|nr:hypothetical protein TTHERM_01106050 [Tetrahymena thermophila SB210]EAR82603.2 hypothetical protein TTHERM_01106050 [Tetrahymena thermophila SB210]|eukprot:XP_001030266.2 hypothetical protein TTHERM_01106050 [Tetrahymena thermophila SB210]